MQDRLAGASQQSSAAAAEDDPFDEIDRCVDEDDDNIGVNSAAGSGKTHLICKLAERQRLLGKRVLALTLNRDAAQELRSRGFKEAQTFHSLAACALRQQGRDATLLQTEEDESDKEDAASEADELPAQEAPKEASALPSKTKLILRELFPDEDGPTGPRQCLEVALFEPFVSHMVSLGKMCAFGIDPMIGGIDNNMDEWLALEKRYEAADLIEGVLRPDNWEKSKLTAHRWKEANQKWPTKSVRVKKGLRMASEAFLASLRFADEAQDQTTIEQMMMVQLGARRVGIVGDDMQALYGWRGADPEALERLFERFGVRRFQLPVCRRCPRSHVALANKVKNETNSQNEDMLPMPDAAEGTIAENADFLSHPLQSSALATTTRRGAPSAAMGGSPVHDGKAILARRNAPLLACLYALAARGISVEMLGKNLLANRLEKTLKDIKPHDLGTLEVGLGPWAKSRKARANPNDNEYTSEDLVECIRALIDELDRKNGARLPRQGAAGKASLDELNKEIGNTFGSADQALPPDRRTKRTAQLATVHKAKGLGWQWVYWLQPEDIPLGFVMKGGGWRARQEKNVEYVASTRSYMHLVKLRHLEVRKEGGLRRAIDSLFGDSAGAAGPSATRSSNDAREREHPWEWWRNQQRWRRAEQEAEEDTDDEGEGLSVAKARAALKLPEDGPISRTQLMTAFRCMAMMRHPDKKMQHGMTADEVTAATAAMQELVEARDMLMREIMAEDA